MSETELPSVELSVDVSVDVDHVWQSLVTDGGLGPWMGDGATIDARVGGKLSFPDVVGGRERHGRVRLVEEGRQLEFVWWTAEEPTRRSEVSITVTPIETGSKITVVETVAPPAPRGFAKAAAVDRAGAKAGANAGSRSVIGAWSWRLALLTVAGQMVRV